MAPSLLTLLEKIPRMIAGKNEAAARPKARATTAATNPGGFIPKYPATITAKNEDILAINNSFFCDMSGRNIFFTKSGGVITSP